MKHRDAECGYMGEMMAIVTRRRAIHAAPVAGLLHPQVIQQLQVPFEIVCHDPGFSL